VITLLICNCDSSISLGKYTYLCVNIILRRIPLVNRKSEKGGARRLFFVEMSEM